MQSTAMPVMELNRLLDRLKNPKWIVETGNAPVASTIRIASWCKHRINSIPEVHLVGLNTAQQREIHKALEEFNLARFCTIHTQSPVLYLSRLPWVDCVIAHPFDLQDGAVQLDLALSAGTQIIAIEHHQTGAALAIEKAKEYGLRISAIEDYAIFER